VPHRSRPDAAGMLLMPRALSTSARAQSCKPSGCATSSSSSAICQSATASASKPVSLQHQSKNSNANALVTTQSRYHKTITALAAQCTGADCCRCRKLRRSSSAVATSRENRSRLRWPPRCTNRRSRHTSCRLIIMPLGSAPLAGAPPLPGRSPSLAEGFNCCSSFETRPCNSFTIL
jgi:hypothetical protein